MFGDMLKRYIMDLQDLLKGLGFEDCADLISGYMYGDVSNIKVHILRISRAAEEEAKVAPSFQDVLLLIQLLSKERQKN